MTNISEGFKSILKGFQTINLFPPKPTEAKKTDQPLITKEDLDAIRSDWDAVSKDIRKGTEEVWKAYERRDK